MKTTLNKTRNPHEVAVLLELTLAKARRLVASCEESIPGWGSLRKQRHIVSRRHVSDNWPKDDRSRIEHHQRLHDQGRVSLCQGRDGSYFILYAMPHDGIAKREPYFFTDRGY